MPAVKGLFQGRLVASTFVVHVMMSASVPDGFRVLERPIGALIMSVQAVSAFLTMFNIYSSYFLGTPCAALHHGWYLETPCRQP